MTHQPEVVSVDLEDRRMVERFIRVPWFINRTHHPSPFWVPPLLFERRRYLDNRKNPFFEHVDAAFWIVRDAGRDVGRVAAVQDFDWPFDGIRIGTFGMFETPRDPTVAGLLLDTATEWLYRRGVESVLGPFDLSTNYSTGVLVNGFDSEPYIDMPYNPPYYDQLLTGYGFSQEKELWQWEIDPAKPTPVRVADLAERVRRRRGLRIRALSKQRWTEEIDLLLDLYNDIWKANWGFVPLRIRELRHIAEGLKRVVRSELALVAEINGIAVAFALIVPNVNILLKGMDGQLFPFRAMQMLWSLRRGARIDSARLMLFGVRRAYRRQGLDAVLFDEMHRAVRRLGVRRVEVGWTADDNVSINRAVLAMHGRRTKTYRVYRLNLEGTVR